MKKYILLCLLTLASLQLLATDPFQIREVLKWDTEVNTFPFGGKALPLYAFEGAQNNPQYPSLPVFSHTFLLDGPGNVDIRMVQEAWESFDPKGIDDQLTSINETIK